MAKTTSQIIAENKKKRAEEAVIDASRNAIHQSQMAEVGAKSAARTAAVLNKAGIKTKTNPNTYEVSVDGDYTPRKKETAQRLDMQKKKEDRLEVKAPVDSAKIKKDRTKKEYDDYIASDEYKKRVEERDKQQKQADIVKLFLPNATPDQIMPKVIRDEKEERLRAARDQAEAEYNASEDQKVIEQDLEAITGLSEEERRQLEAYAVGRVQDQNQTLEMQGIAPTAQQDAAGLIQKYGRQRVDELAETYMRQQNADLARQVEEQARQQANEHGFWSSLATIPVNALGGVVGAVGQLQGAARRTGRYQTLDPNEVGTIGDTYSGAVRGQVQQNIEGEDPNFLRKAASIGYQGVMSAADSVARAYLGGGALGGAALAATGSFSQTMAEASKRGATPAQAALLATTTAGIEALSEKIPLDNLIRTAKGGTQTVMQMVKTALMQAGIEATTEEISLIGTVLMDAAIMQEKSEYQLSITSKIMQGMDPAQARDMADQELIDEAVNTALVSMASGGMSSLGGSAVAQYQQNRADAMANPAVNKPKNAQQATQTAIENNRARQERMAAEEAAQEAIQPQTEAQPVQKSDGELVQEAVAERVREVQRQKQEAEAQTKQAPVEVQKETQQEKSVNKPKKSELLSQQPYISVQKNSNQTQTERSKTEDTHPIPKTEKPAGKPIKDFYYHPIKIAPSASFFGDQPMQGEKNIQFRLHDDNSVELKLEPFSGGELFTPAALYGDFGALYDFVIDGKRVSEDEALSNNGYYTFSDEVRPVVRELNGGNFMPAQKGELHLYSDLRDPIDARNQKQGLSQMATAEAQPVQAPVEVQEERQAAPTQPEETSDSEDEFENWGRDPNREGVEDPIADRNSSEVGKRSVKAYMYENPDVKPFYQEQAAWMLSELADSTKGERTYNEQVHYESGGEKGWSGNKRHTSDSIAQLLDEEGMSYDEIERGLNAIINDNGQENNAASKRIELIINDRLMNGYTDFYTGKRVEGNADYLNMLRNRQSTQKTDMQMGANNQSTSGEQIKGTGAAEQNFTGKAAYQELLQEGNVQRDRPGDVRPVEVPKTDTQGRKVSETVGNFYGAAVTSDEMANRIEELVQDGALSYDTRTNKQSLENASAEITKRGEESVRAAIAKNVGQNKIQDGDIEKALLLYAKDANDPNRQEAAAEMMVQLQEMATMSGRNLQLFRLVRRMTPEGQLMAIQKEVRANTEKMIKSGSVKKGFEPVANTELEQEYMKAAKDAKNAKTDKARQEAEASMKELQDAMYLDAAAQMPSTFKAKWDAWRYMAMLGNAKTQVRNVVGNAAFKPYKEVKDKMGALAEKLFVPKDQRTKSLITDQGLIQWARNDRKNNAEVQVALRYSAKLGDDVSTQKTRESMQVFNNKALEGVRKFVEGVPQAGDMLFKSNYYERSLSGFLKARGYTAADIQNGNVSDAVLTEARSYAIQEAMKATFNDSNAFSDFMATGLRYKGENPIGKALNLAAEGVLPFRRTPANIAVRFTEYSPVGVAKGLWNAATKVRNGEMTAATAIDQLSSGLTGSAVMALGFALAGGLNGIKITGSGTDEDEKRQGHQDYALEFSVDGQEYSYKIDWAAPANLPLFVGANIYSALENTGEDTDVSKFTSFIRGMGTMFEPLLALSCMSSLNELVEGVRYAEEGEALYSMAAKAATSYFTQGIPALARQAYQASQENKQTTFANSNDPTIRDMQTTAAGIPFVGAKYQTDKVNAWGEKENMGDLGTRIVNAFVNPGTLKKIDNSAVEQEITRLNKSQEESVTPPYISKVITYTDSDGNLHKNYRLSEEEYTKIATTQGQTARRIIETMLDSKNYQAMSDAEKAKAIKQVYAFAREKGMVDNIEGHTGYSESWMMEMREGKESEEILRRITNSELNRTMTNLDTAWDNGYNTEARSRELAAAYDSYSKMTAAQKREIRDFATGTTAKYIEARERGISHDDFLKAAKNVGTVKGTGKADEKTGVKSVRDIDRRQAIANTTGLSLAEIDRIMWCYMPDYDPDDPTSDKTELKYNYIRQEMGLTPKEYAETYRSSLDFSKKKDKIAAIMDLGYDRQTATTLYNIYSSTSRGKKLYMAFYENG